MANNLKETRTSKDRTCYATGKTIEKGTKYWAARGFHFSRDYHIDHKPLDYEIQTNEWLEFKMRMEHRWKEMQKTFNEEGLTQEPMLGDYNRDICLMKEEIKSRYDNMPASPQSGPTGRLLAARIDSIQVVVKHLYDNFHSEPLAGFNVTFAP